MSITITTDVFCDDDDCVHWVFGTNGARSNPAGARKRARRFGWVRIDGKDYCPEHAERSEGS